MLPAIIEQRRLAAPGRFASPLSYYSLGGTGPRIWLRQPYPRFKRKFTKLSEPPFVVIGRKLGARTKGGLGSAVSYYTLGFAGPRLTSRAAYPQQAVIPQVGQPVAPSIDCCCGGTVCTVCATTIVACPPTIGNITYTFTGKNVSASCTAAAGTTCCVSLNNDPGPVSVSASGGTCALGPNKIAIACGGTAVFCAACDTNFYIIVCETSYCSFVEGEPPLPVPDATVTIDCAGGINETQTVDSSGCALFLPELSLDGKTCMFTGGGPCTLTVDAGPKFNIFTLPNIFTPFGINACAGQFIPVTMVPSTGWVCGCGCNPWPMPDPLYLGTGGGVLIPATRRPDGTWLWCVSGLPSIQCSSGILGGTCICSNGGSYDMPPLDIGPCLTSALFSLSCSTEPVTGKIIFQLTQYPYGSITFYDKSCPPGGTGGGTILCSLNVFCTTWLYEISCQALEQIGIDNLGFGYPSDPVIIPKDCENIDLTFTFPGGSFTGPSPAGCPGSPPATIAIVSS